MIGDCYSSLPFVLLHLIQIATTSIYIEDTDPLYNVTNRLSLTVLYSFMFERTWDRSHTESSHNLLSNAKISLTHKLSG